MLRSTNASPDATDGATSHGGAYHVPTVSLRPHLSINALVYQCSEQARKEVAILSILTKPTALTLALTLLSKNNPIEIKIVQHHLQCACIRPA